MSSCRILLCVCMWTKLLRDLVFVACVRNLNDFCEIALSWYVSIISISLLRDHTLLHNLSASWWSIVVKYIYCQMSRTTVVFITFLSVCRLLLTVIRSLRLVRLLLSVCDNYYRILVSNNGLIKFVLSSSVEIIEDVYR